MGIGDSIGVDIFARDACTRLDAGQGADAGVDLRPHLRSRGCGFEGIAAIHAPLMGYRCAQPILRLWRDPRRAGLDPPPHTSHRVIRPTQPRQPLSEGSVFEPRNRLNENAATTPAHSSNTPHSARLRQLRGVAGG